MGREQAWIRRVPLVARIASHVTIWVLILIPTVVQLARGWTTIGDDSVIAFRSSEVFSVHTPLLGEYSSASTLGSHTVFDLGPLAFWILAIPVHIDPAQGTLWGAAIACGAVLSLAVEALWRSDCWLGGVLLAFVVAELAWQAPQVFANPAWNPYFGLLFLTASVALAWVVAMGHFGWWPVLVIVGSVAAQSHLGYSVPALALIAVAPVIGLATTGPPIRLRWVVAGIAAGLTVWALPLDQELTGHPGNMTLLLHANHGTPRAGLPFSLKVVALAGDPVPVWLRRLPTSFPAGQSMAGLVRSHSSLVGILVGLLLVAVTVVAWRQKLASLVALAAVSLTLGCGLVVTVASLPVAAESTNLNYLIWIWLAFGILVWATAVLAAVELVRYLLATRRSDTAAPWRDVRLREGAIVVGLAGLAAVVVLGAVQVVTPARPPLIDVSQIGAVRSFVGHSVPRGPVMLDMPHPFLVDEAGISWQLKVDGWQPTIQNGLLADITGLGLPAGSKRPTVLIATHSIAITQCLASGRSCGSQLSVTRIR